MVRRSHVTVFTAVLAAVVAVSSDAFAQERASGPPSSVSPRASISVVLTPDERELLARGEISTGAHVGGSIAAFTLGLGTGQAIQGRWLSRGWIFTVGELASVVMWSVAAAESDLDTNTVGFLGTAGVLGFVGLHIWECVDAITAPGRHNRKVRDLRVRMAAGSPPPALRVQPFIAPPSHGNGAVAGMLIRF